MSSTFSSVLSLTQMFNGKLQQFLSDIDNVHMIWLEEIQQEANRMFSSDFNAEPELMPKTPSQKRSNRRKRVSLGYQEENRAKRRFSKGKRSKLRGSSVKTLNLITEDESIPEATTSEVLTQEPQSSPCRNEQTRYEVSVDAAQSSPSSFVPNKEQDMANQEEADKQSQVNNIVTEGEVDSSHSSSTTHSPLNIPSSEVEVRISAEDRLSAEMALRPEPSPGRSATKITIAGTPKSSRRSSVRHSLKLRHSLAGLRHSMTQESVRRASRRSLLKKRSHVGNSICSSNVSDANMESDVEEVGENREAMLSAVTAEVEQSETVSEDLAEQNTLPSVHRITRSMAVNSPTMAPPSLLTSKLRPGTSDMGSDGSAKKPSLRSRQNAKRKAPEITEESPTKKCSPPKKSQSAVRPNMKSFLHTVQKNQMLMMTPGSFGRSNVIKSFIKHTTPLKVDLKDSRSGVVTRELMKLEALKKKQEQEEERMKKMEEEKKRKQEEQKRKRDERLRRVVEARVKEEQRGEEKKKKIEQKMAQIDEKNDKLRVERIAEEKAKKKVAMKRQEEIEQRRKLEEEARRKKIQQAEDEKRQQELLAKRKAEEEEEQRARKLAEARRALELRREQELERERERQAAAERERAEKEKALALQRELEKAAREKEKRELEEKRKELEERRKREEEQRLAAAEEKAAKEREAAKQREAAAKKALTADIQHSVLKTPVGKGPGLNVTVDIEHSAMKTPVGKGAGLNVTVDIEQSPQSYNITPKGGNKPIVPSKNPDDYGMDQNSDDSTDDESAPRKKIPSWAEGHNLQQAIMKQYFIPPDLVGYFGVVEQPRLENIFYKSKPRYFKRTSSAVWHSPPRSGNHF